MKNDNGKQRENEDQSAQCFRNIAVLEQMSQTDPAQKQKEGHVYVKVDAGNAPNSKGPSHGGIPLFVLTSLMRACVRLSLPDSEGAIAIPVPAKSWPGELNSW